MTGLLIPILAICLGCTASTGPSVGMPAHTSRANVGQLALSNGALLPHRDRAMNDHADKFAKAAAQ